jgi:hypothetical protein
MEIQGQPPQGVQETHPPPTNSWAWCHSKLCGRLRLEVSWLQATLGRKKFSKLHHNGKMLGTVARACHFSNSEKPKTGRLPGPDQPISKIAKAKRAGSLAQVVDRLPSKW